MLLRQHMTARFKISAQALERFVIRVAGTGVIFFLCILLFRFFVLNISVVAGISMQPTLRAGSSLVVDKLSLLFRAPRRGEIVQIISEENDALFVKRVVGLPGEKIRIYNDRLYINKSTDWSVSQQIPEPYLPLHMQTRTRANMPTEFTIPPHHYFVLGDNRGNSNDSRVFGPINRSKITGRIVWPFIQ